MEIYFNLSNNNVIEMTDVYYGSIITKPRVWVVFNAASWPAEVKWCFKAIIHISWENLLHLLVFIIFFFI